jgi:hypothetical protein
VTHAERAVLIYDVLNQQSVIGSHVEYIRTHLEEVVTEDRAARAIPGAEMTPERLVEIQARADQATPQEWQARREDEDSVVAWTKNEGEWITRLATINPPFEEDIDPENEPPESVSQRWANAKFIAAARQDVPDLLAYISYLEALIRDGLASGELAAWEAGRQSAFVEVAKRPPSPLSFSG